MLGVLWPVVHITQHPEPIYPAVANTSSNSRLGDVCQSQLWPMGSSHTLSHSINSNRYSTQMCHAYPDIPLTLNWHNSRGNTDTFSFKKMYLKMSSGKWRPSCLGLNVLNSVTSYKCSYPRTCNAFLVLTQFQLQMTVNRRNIQYNRLISKLNDL